MSLQKYVQQLKPIQEAILKKDDLFKRDNQKTFIDFALNGKLITPDKEPLPKVKPNDPLLDNIKNAKDKKDVEGTASKLIFNKGTKDEFLLGDAQKTQDFGGKGDAPDGADWESIITTEYNKLIKNADFDKEANKTTSKFESKYIDAGTEIAKSFKDKLKINQPMKQFGGSGGKDSLSKSWTTWGGTNGTPKTDMLTNEMNISLKKKGGAQLASGVAGETIATFNATLEYLGQTREGVPELDSIMTKIEEGFTKLYTDYTATELGDKAAGVVRKGKNKGKKVTYTKDEEEVIKQYLTTDEFHKKLTEEIKDVLPNLSNSDEFKKWYVFECMSGYKKFNQKDSVASICVEFDEKKGTVSKKYVVTKDGTTKGLKGTPTVSGDIEQIAPYVKLYAAWKTPKVNPYSALRVGLTLPKNFQLSNSYEEDTMLTLRGIIHNEVHQDKIANALLTEEMHSLDEFQIIKRTIGKLKQMGKKVKTWLSALLGKIMKKLKVAFNKIKKLGEKMFDAFFKFIGIELNSAKATLPKDILKFVYNKNA